MESTSAAERIAQSLATTHSADECVQLAGGADQIGNRALQWQCLERAVALNRNHQGALMTLAALSLDDGDVALTYSLVEEAARVAPLPEAVRPLHAELLEQVRAVPALENYLRAVGRSDDGPAERRLSIVIVTNLFPPQELGGYGRMIWEFAHGLAVRGHQVRVLTSDVSDFGKAPTAEESALEPRVMRSLRLLGTWVGGKAVPLTDRNEIVRRARDNYARMRTAIAKMRADVVLAGNLDFLGVSIVGSPGTELEFAL